LGGRIAASFLILPAASNKTNEMAPKADFRVLLSSCRAMRTFYYQTFGSARSQEDLADSISKLLDISFTRRNSDYKGPYFMYQGPCADELTIEDNHEADGWRYEQFKGHDTLIFASFTEGKNVDKASRSQHLKELLINLPGVTLIEESIHESN